MPKPVLNILLFCLLFSIEGFSGIFHVSLTEKCLLQTITQANAGKDSAICVTGLQLYANTPGTDEAGTWQVLTGTGILSNPTIPNSIYSSSANGVNVLSWSILNTITSELSIDTVIVTINPPPTIANAGVNVITCNSGLRLGGNTPVTGSGKWNVLSGSGNFLNNTLGNTSVTGLTPGFNIYQWTITNVTCKSISTVSINFNAANAGSNQEVCIDNTFLNGNPPSVNNGQWTQTYPALIGDGSDPYFDDDLDPQTQIFQLRPGLNILKWTTRNFSPNSCATSALVTILSNVVSTADAGTNQTVCGNLALLNAAPITLGSGTWSILTGAGANIPNSTFTNTTITNLPKGASMVQWSVTKGICYSRDTVTVTNNSPSQATILSPKKPFICSDTTTLVAMVPVQGTGKWTRISGTATITAPNNLTTSLTGIPLGVSQYLWIVSFPGCTSSYDTVTVTRQNPETAQVQTHYLQMCNSNIITITGLNTTPGLGIWQTVTGNGIIANPNNYQTTISFSGIGRTKLQWQINIAGCAPSIDTMTIDHNSVSIATVTGSRNQTICTDSLLLTGVNPTIGTGMWSFFSGTGTFLNTTVSGTITKNLSPNRNILHWTVTNSFCSSFITVTITNNKPSNAQTNADKSICIANDTLIAVAATQGTGVWSVLTSTGIIGSGAANSKLVSNLNLGKNSFLWTITKGTCKSYDTLNLTNKSPSPANILTVNDTLLCRDFIYLRSRTPIQGTGLWFNISGTGIISTSSIIGTVTGTSITGLSYGQNIFSWRVSVPGCAASMQTVTVNNHKVTVPAGSAMDSCLSVNASNPATIYLNANASSNPGESATWRTILSPGSTTYPLNTPTVTVNGVGGSGFYKFGWKITDASGQCVSEDTVAIAVLPKALPAINECLKTNSAMLLNTTLTSSTSLKTSQGEYGSWSYISANHPYDLLNASITVNSVTGIIGGLDKGVHTFYYTTRNSNMPVCRSFDSTIVTVLTKADVGNKRLCLSGLNYTTVGVNSVINTSVGGRGTWTGITFGTNISQSGSTSISADITIPTMAGVYKFAFTTSNINDLSCIDTDTLSVTNLSAPYAGIDTYTLTTTTSAQIKLNGTINVVNTAGEIGNWTFTGAPAFIIDSMSNPKSPVHNLLPGINRMMWKITNTISGCSLQDTVVAYVQTKANAGVNLVTLTSGLLTNVTITSPITLNTTRGETGSWSLVSTTGTTSLTSTAGSNIYTTGFNNLRRGAYLFRWTVANTSIPGFSNTSDMHLTVMTKAITGTFCGVTDTLTVGRAPSIRISPVAGEIYNWSSPSIPGINPILADSTPLAKLLGIPIGLSKLYLTITNTISNVSNRDSVFLTHITKPNAGKDTFLLASPVNNLANLTMYSNPNNPAAGETGKWSILPPASATPFPITLPNATATGIVPGVNPMVWTITNTISGCVLRDTLNVFVQTKANAGANVVIATVNQLTNVTLTSPVTIRTDRGENGWWKLVSTTGTAFPASTAGSNIYTTGFNNLRRGAYLFRWTVANPTFSGFNSSIQGSNINDMYLTLITKAITGTFCGFSDTLTVGHSPSVRISPAAGETYVWSSPSIPGINPIVADSMPLAKLSGIPPGLSKLYLTVTNTTNNVISKDSIFITQITKPFAGTLSGVLLTASTVDLGMNANAPNNLVGEIGYWSYYAPANVTPLPATLPNATATGLTPGVNPLVWTITNTLSGCFLKDTIKVLVQTKADAGSAIVFKNPNPAIAYTGTITSPNLLATSRGEYGKWTLVSTTAYRLPTSTIGGNMNTLNLTNLRRGVSVFRWTVYNVSFPGSPAYSNSSDVDITVMTKAIADTNKRCITDSINITLGNRPTVPIRPIGGEIFAWTSKPQLPANSIIFTETDSIPLATVLGLPMGQTKFYFSITSTGSGAIDVDSVVITKVTNPDLGINITPFPLCDTIFHLQPVNVPQTLTGESFQWQKLNGGSHFSNASYNPYVLPLDTGNNTFKYTITNGTCIKSRTVTLRNNQPYLATITGANTSCFTSNPLQGNNPTLQFKTATSEWLFVRQPKAIGSDTAIFQTPNQPSTIVNPMVLAGVYTFRYKVKNMGCEILSDTFNIIRGTSISINPPMPYITICRNYFVMQAEPLQPNVTGTWTSLDIGLPDSVLHNPNFTLTGLGALSTGKPYRFYWNTRTDVCVNPPYPITVVAFSKPSIATISQGDLPLSFCERDTISLSSVVPVGGVNGNHLWYASPSGGNFSNPLSGSTLMSNLRYGTNHIIYQVSTGDSCPVNRDTITIIRYQRTTNISPGSDSLVCGNIIRLNTETPNVAGALARWSIVSTLTAPISDPTDPKANITTSISGNYKLKWRVTNGACIDSSQITYKVREIPTRASVTKDTLPICDTTTYILKGNIPVIGKGKWSSIGNSNRITNDTLPVTKTYITNYGKNWFAWIISNDFCTSSDTISITNSIPPTRAKAGENTTICSSEVTLTGNNPTNGTPEWVMTNHTLTATSYTNSVLAKNLNAGPNTFIYKIQSPGCAPSLDSIIVTYNMATLAFAGRDTIICTDTLVLHANIPVQGIGKWGTENGTGKFEDLEDPKTRLTTIGNGANTYTWTITNGDCQASISKIKISNNKPSLISFPQDKSVYKNFTELNGSIPINGIGKWLKLKGNGIIEEPANPTSTVINLDAGENIFRWSVRNLGCDSIYFDQKINFTDLLIPNGFSPNNDSFNDKFKILGIEEYQQEPWCKLEVFNRWGKLVYSNDKYSPDTEWDGTDNKNEVLGNDTYFYVLTLSNQKVYKNSVLLTR